MSLPKIVSQDEWTAARRTLLEKEKDFTRAAPSPPLRTSTEVEGIGERCSALSRLAAGSSRPSALARRVSSNSPPKKQR